MKLIKYTNNRLVIVEGLTGLGKSTVAHFIARQLQLNAVAATWVHEGEVPHPVSIELDTDIKNFMLHALSRWDAFVNKIEVSGEVTVIEAGLFNNLFETLFMHNVSKHKIHQFSDDLQGIIKPLQPALVYLAQSDVSEALEKNFNNRGAGFMDYVIKVSTNNPYAQNRGLQGFQGMVVFWQDFVTLTNECFDRFQFQKIALDNSTGDWVRLKSRVTEFLSIPYIVERQVSDEEAARHIGTYTEEASGKEYVVQYRDHELTINIFLEDWTRLIPITDCSFIAEGWHFEVCFEEDTFGKIESLRIDGQDIDYLSLAGTVAKKMSN